MEKETGAVRKVTNYKDAEYDSNPSKPYYIVSMGIAVKEMTTPMVSTTYVKYNGKWWSGLQINNKFIDYVNERFAVSNSDKEKTLLADMLTFGAAAQKYFKFNLSDLATDYLGEYASYVTTTAPVIEDKTVNGLVNASERNHVGYNLYSLELGSVIKVKLGFRTDFYTGTEPLGELSAVCSYTDNSGNVRTKTYTSADYEPIPNKASRYQFFFDGMAAKDMRKIITCTINNESGPIGFDLQTSIESVACMLRNQTNDANLKAVIDAMITYGDSANAYFTK